MRYDVTWCDVIRRGAIWYHCQMPTCNSLYYAMLYHTTLCVAILCDTIACYEHAVLTSMRCNIAWCCDAMRREATCTPNLSTGIIPTKIAWLKLSGNFPMGLGVPPLKLKILLESNPLKSRILVRRLAVWHHTPLANLSRRLPQYLDVHVDNPAHTCKTLGSDRPPPRTKTNPKCPQRRSRDAGDRVPRWGASGEPGSSRHKSLSSTTFSPGSLFHSSWPYVVQQSISLVPMDSRCKQSRAVLRKKNKKVVSAQTRSQARRPGAILTIKNASSNNISSSNNSI